MAIAAAARGGCARCASASRRATRTGSGATAGRYRPSRRGGQISSRARLDRPQGPQNATCGRVPSKKIQAKPRKTKEKCLDLLGFIRPNRDFSRGYSESSFPVSTRLSGCTPNVSGARCFPSLARRRPRAGSILSAPTSVTRFSVCAKKDLEVRVATGRQIIFEQVTRERRSPRGFRKSQSPL